MLSYLTHLGVFLFKRCFIVEHPSPDGLLLLIHVIFNRTNTNEEARRRVYAIAFQMQCKCNAIASRLKVTIVTTIKKGLPGNPHIAHFAHYKKRSPERHETKSQMLANFLAKQMKNTQTSHDIKKGYFIFVGGRKWKPIKKGK